MTTVSTTLTLCLLLLKVEKVSPFLHHLYFLITSFVFCLSQYKVHFRTKTKPFSLAPVALGLVCALRGRPTWTVTNAIKNDLITNKVVLTTVSTTLTLCLLLLKVEKVSPFLLHLYFLITSFVFCLSQYVSEGVLKNCLQF